MYLHLDCKGGEPGKEGKDGEPGKGGQGGAGGPGGPGLRAGRKGKPGKDAKRAKRQGKADGTPGHDGAFTFCVYDDRGNFESGAKPYRLMYHKTDDKLKPSAINFGKPDLGGPFVYGQQVKFGPARPMNVGSLSSPPSKLEGRIMGRCNGTDVLVSSTSVNFPPVPAAKGTRNGELDKSAAMSATMWLPPVGPPLLPGLSPDNFPFPLDQWRYAPKRKVVTEYKWTVDGLPFKRVEEDQDLMSVLRSVNEVIIPIDLVNQAGKAVQCPAHVALGHDKVSEFSLEVANKLMGIDVFDTEGWEVVLRCAGLGFMASISAKQSPSLKKEELAAIHGWQVANFRKPIPPVPANATHKFDFSFEVNSDSTRFGSMLCVRPELVFNGVTVSCGPPAFARMCPPPPSTSNVNPEAAVVVFSHDAMRPEDFEIVKRTCAEFNGATAVFLEVQRFMNSSGEVPLALWEKFLGKAPVVWIPHDECFANAVPVKDLEAHLAQGGGLVTTHSSFKGQAWTHARRVVADARGMAVALTAADTQTEIEGTTIGAALWPLLSALLDQETTATKFQLLSKPPQMLKHSLPVAAPIFVTKEVHFPAKSGSCLCLGGGSPERWELQVQAEGTGPLTLEDYMTVAITADVERDMAAFKISQRLAEHPALVELEKMLGADSQNLRLLGYLSAVFNTVESSLPTQLNMSKKKQQAVDPVTQWMESMREKVQAGESKLRDQKQNPEASQKRLAAATKEFNGLRASGANRETVRNAELSQSLREKTNLLPGIEPAEYLRTVPATESNPDFEVPDFVAKEPAPLMKERVRMGKAGQPPTIETSKDMSSPLSSTIGVLSAVNKFKEHRSSSNNDSKSALSLTAPNPGADASPVAAAVRGISADVGNNFAVSAELGLVQGEDGPGPGEGDEGQDAEITGTEKDFDGELSKLLTEAKTKMARAGIDANSEEYTAVINDVTKLMEYKRPGRTPSAKKWEVQRMPYMAPHVINEAVTFADSVNALRQRCEGKMQATPPVNGPFQGMLDIEESLVKFKKRMATQTVFHRGTHLARNVFGFNNFERAFDLLLQGNKNTLESTIAKTEAAFDKSLAKASKVKSGWFS